MSRRCWLFPDERLVSALQLGEDGWKLIANVECLLAMEKPLHLLPTSQKHVEALFRSIQLGDRENGCELRGREDLPSLGHVARNGRLRGHREGATIGKQLREFLLGAADRNRTIENSVCRPQTQPLSKTQRSSSESAPFVLPVHVVENVDALLLTTPSETTEPSLTSIARRF